MKKEVDFERLSESLVFTGRLRHGLQYRKNKTVKDISKALQKATKKGRGKTEFELSMLEIYLKDVFKKYYVE